MTAAAAQDKAKANGRAAVVCVNSWAGRQEHPCRVIGETQHRYRIAVDKPTPLPPRSRVLQPGENKLVPKYAIRFVEPLLASEEVPSAECGGPAP